MRFGYEHSTADLSRINRGLMETSSHEQFVLAAHQPGRDRDGYGWPRIGVDVFVVRGLTVGGALGFLYLAPEMGSNTRLFLVAPRIGYAATLAPGLAIWPRVGITYWNISNDSSTSSSSSAFALTIEAPLAIQLAPRVQFLIGRGRHRPGRERILDGRRHDQQPGSEVHRHRRARRSARVPVKRA